MFQLTKSASELKYAYLAPGKYTGGLILNALAGSPGS
jgi:hypothetical protein